MRLAALQPSVSITLAHLGKLDTLCAATRYCLDALPELAERQVAIIQDSWAFVEADRRTLKDAKPDLVIASVPYRQESLTAILKSGFPVLALAPQTLADIYRDILLIARTADALPVAALLVERFQLELAQTQGKVAGVQAPRVYCEEWGKPLIHSQQWVAELVAAAGGSFVGKPGAQTKAETVAEADPDVLIFAWCGAGDRVPLDRVIEQRGWRGLRAVLMQRVFCIPDEFLNTPSFNLLDGLRALAGALHPELFPAHPAVKRSAR